MLRVAVVLPTYSHFDYAAAAALSLLNCDPKKISVDILVVDDGSPDWTPQWLTDIREATGEVVQSFRFPDNAGLTRSLNFGIHDAIVRMDADFVAAVNSDVIAPKDWAEPLIAAVTSGGLDFTGPTSNACGTSGVREQDIRFWWPEYELTDDQAAIDLTQARLRHQHPGKTFVGAINGFFMFASAWRWKSVAHDFAAGLIFPSRIDKMPSFRSNPQPTMAGQEDWLAAQCRRKGFRMGITVDAFCAHYRSVSRGDNFKTPGWFRRKIDT